MSPRPVRWAPLGYTLDGVLLCAVAYLASQHPGVARVRAVGVAASLAALPTPLTAANASGFFIPAGRPASARELAAQSWFAYALGDDLGAGAAARPEAAYFHASNAWKNALVLPAALRRGLPHVLAIWLRNMLAGWALYFGVGGAWAAVIYGLRARACFPRGAASMPSWRDMRAQMRVSAEAMVIYSLAPTVGEWAIERGWTRAFHDPAHAASWLGLPAAAAGGGGGGAAATATAAVAYAATLLAYMLLVEWGIYWIHRGLHEHRGLYNLLHRPHHIYNNAGALSPFAGLAFHPIDGLLQAAPYGLLLLLLPVHFWTYEALLFFTAIWTTNIHDTLVVASEPVMGSAYHTVHHTTYRDNYGQLFVLFDWLHDTLVPLSADNAEAQPEAEPALALGAADTAAAKGHAKVA